jgi:hypothetical protein
MRIEFMVHSHLMMTRGPQCWNETGSMCNAAGYRWKRFRGHQRQPYKGWWHPIACLVHNLVGTLELLSPLLASFFPELPSSFHPVTVVTR